MRSLVRGLDIFELMARGGGALSVSDIVSELGIPRTSAFEVVRTLRQRGYLERTEGRDGTYFLGRQLYELGLAYQAESRLLREAADTIRALRNEVGETVQLSVLDEDDLNLVLLRAEGHHGVRITARVGNHFPINWSASGCLLAADWPDEEFIRRVSATMRPSPTGRAPMDVRTVLRDARRFRQQGYAFKLGHAHDHVAMIAVPVDDGRGRCIAAITIAAYELGLSETRKRRLIEAALNAAQLLSARLRHG